MARFVWSVQIFILNRIGNCIAFKLFKFKFFYIELLVEMWLPAIIIHLTIICYCHETNIHQPKLSFVQSLNLCFTFIKKSDNKVKNLLPNKNVVIPHGNSLKLICSSFILTKSLRKSVTKMFK